MKFIAGVGAALCFAPAAYATDVQGCDTPNELAVHETAIKQMIEAMHAGKASNFAVLVPDGTYGESVDHAQERLIARPFEAADMEKLASSHSYTVRKQETSPPYTCGSLIIKWTRPGESKAHWMNVFEFRNGLLAKVTETDLVELEKRGPPPAPPLLPRP